MSRMDKLEPLQILVVDATPDENYPIRILEAYYQNAKRKWTGGSDWEQQMNEAQEKRKRILQKSIIWLKKMLQNEM
jgi:hypothetical protein